MLARCGGESYHNDISCDVDVPVDQAMFSPAPQPMAAVRAADVEWMRPLFEVANCSAHAQANASALTLTLTGADPTPARTWLTHARPSCMHAENVGWATGGGAFTGGGRLAVAVDP